ncbi:hypothetical protein AMS68_001967 [Peltaster fructicola]|uniref:Protein BZZ1 n=1 Tax=Peltaster fructicola TaxID=286661 RepID=A0A6H0XPP2_9PEZI|nr:hypothetical protein AMS68_001967 [Peltaster fructicola]
MVDVDIAPNFGAELKDGFKPVNAWVGNTIAWLDDIQQFYRERSAIEKEYGQKLSGLAKRYFEKKAKKSSILSVGETPTATPGSLESASMTTWTVHLTTLESRATEHEQYANQLITNIAEPLKLMAAKYEDLRKQHAEYASKLERERDGQYSELKKIKGKYDSVCQEVENRRKKVDGSFDHGKSKAQSAFLQQQADMKNAKNTYLIAINVTNKQKERYYHEYVPDLLDSLQGLNETRVSTLNNLWNSAASMEKQALSHSTELVQHLITEIPRNKPALDSMMFVRHNASQWSDPPDFAFEPSPVWLDDDAMATDQASKIFVMNILAKSKNQITPLKREADDKRREVEAAKKVRQLIREGRDKRDEVEVVRAMFVHQEALHDVERRRVTAEVEVSTITSVMGDISIGMQNHAFKNQTFKIPTNCDLCGDRIWGLSAKGLSCTDCGYTCHLKCELKVPADCPGELDKEAKKNIKAQRQAAAATLPQAETPAENGRSTQRSSSGLQRSDTIGSMNTLSSGYERSVSGMSVKTRDDEAPSGRNRLIAPPPMLHSNSGTNGDSQEQKGKMLYPYQANADGEINISEGQEFVVVEEDDGSGWLKIKPASGAAGLVPASYAELRPKLSSSVLSERPRSTASGSTASLPISDAPLGKKVGPAVAPRRGAKKLRYVEALYTYAASGPGEVNMTEGERMVLIQPDQGDGWCEVESQAGKGVVPAGWCREL